MENENATNQNVTPKVQIKIDYTQSGVKTLRTLATLITVFGFFGGILFMAYRAKEHVGAAIVLGLYIFVSCIAGAAICYALASLVETGLIKRAALLHKLKQEDIEILK